MVIVEKSFDELTKVELYELLKSRAEIFVVEQTCIYQDLDDIDYRSIHVFSMDDTGRVTAYLRLFDKANENQVVHMGRVLTLQHGIGLGGMILSRGIDVSFQKMNAKEIYIEAQVYAKRFYEREGFCVCSEEFLEDGIPHVQMRLSRSEYDLR